MFKFIIIFIFISINAQANCIFGEDTWDLKNNNQKFKVVAKKSIDENQFTNQEKYWAITHISKEYTEITSLDQFLRLEVLRYHNELNITYIYSYDLKRYYGIVNTYPGDTEVGLIVDVRTNRFVANINDGYISCF